MIDNTLFSCSGSANLCISSFLQDHASLRVVSAMDSQKSILSIVAWKVTLATAVGMSNSSINQVLVLLPRLEALPEHKICNKVRVPKAFVKSHKWYWVDDPSDSMLAMEGKQVTLIVDSSGRMENIVFRPGTPVKGEFKMTPSLRPRPYSDSDFTGGRVVLRKTPGKSEKPRGDIGVVLVPNGSKVQVQFADGKGPTWIATDSLCLMKFHLINSSQPQSGDDFIYADRKKDEGSVDVGPKKVRFALGPSSSNYSDDPPTRSDEDASEEDVEDIDENNVDENDSVNTRPTQLAPFHSSSNQEEPVSGIVVSSNRSTDLCDRATLAQLSDAMSELRAEVVELKNIWSRTFTRSI